jgi:hypothetical protein
MPGFEPFDPGRSVGGVLDRIPGEVVIRHVCARDMCRHAPERPADGDDDEHTFTVDGEDFPWLLTERGPTVSRLRDDLFVVDVEIILLTKDRGETRTGEGAYCDLLSFSWVADAGTIAPAIPIIGGVEFPWLLTMDERVLTFGHTMLPKLALRFFAKNVIGNSPVEDLRPNPDVEPEAVFCAGGEMIADGTVPWFGPDEAQPET